jgi:hypothetical protein
MPRGGVQQVLNTFLYGVGAEFLGWVRTKAGLMLMSYWWAEGLQHHDVVPWLPTSPGIGIIRNGSGRPRSEWGTKMAPCGPRIWHSLLVSRGLRVGE